MTTEIQTHKTDNAAALMRVATDVAGVSRDIVLKTACNIQGRKYVKVEGWQAIAIAHGCVLSARDVTRLDTGIRAIGEVKRASDGMILSTAEGFVGFTEKNWSSRDEYAQRAMAQTRAMSRAARTAFAHVVVMMDAGLSTTPAEEVPEGGFSDQRPPTASASAQPPNGPPPKTLDLPPVDDWREVQIHFGKNKGSPLGDLAKRDKSPLHWYFSEWMPKKKMDTKFPPREADERLFAALEAWHAELEEKRMTDEQFQKDAQDQAQENKKDDMADSDVEF